MSDDMHACPYHGLLANGDVCGQHGCLCDRCKEDMANDRAALIAGGLEAICVLLSDTDKETTT